MPDTLSGLRERFPDWTFIADAVTGVIFGVRESGRVREFVHGETAKEVREKLEDEGE